MTDELLVKKQTEIDRLISVCIKNRWEYAKTSGALCSSHQQANIVLLSLRRTVSDRSEGKRMRSDGTYF